MIPDDLSITTPAFHQHVLYLSIFASVEGRSRIFDNYESNAEQMNWNGERVRPHPKALQEWPNATIKLF